ncbi:hypothetical protein CAPTEDRAFT_228913 [Capitella teleta]|uniref:tRNA-5-taurinomethyluridine 2-sulfurtransferase n=1 Tax=Capitella teleta TaxID=283909 RepID=R7VK78_CAPTE|nr:hypothetical protein CAPTEDRAFT_228913 [Capitella teleta]|eukprot:ELU17106.1 hypothetical protein CAPTEDRAFT_228913 [Capitella teleta]
MKSIKHVACGISGGVDSAVSAYLLKQKGFQVTGLFMVNWDLRNEVGVCTGDGDKEDAQYVCDHLKIPFKEVNFVKEYWNDVFSQLICGYEKGLTPNPDVLCNKFVKFGPFYQHAIQRLGADAIATGHYARNSAGQYLENLREDTNVDLLCSVDQWKDQTLFLSQVPQVSLRHTMFPVGGLLKSRVREIACEAGLAKIAKKRDSMGICFIGKRHFQDFIDDYIEPHPGNFVDVETGKVVGRHQGIQHFTIGQRTHIAGLNKAFFVAHRCSQTQDILVAKGTGHPALFFDSMFTTSPHWINQAPKHFTVGNVLELDFRFQHVHPLVKCTATRLDDGGILVTLREPMRAITPGQYAVFYDGERCLGSAQVIRNGPSMFELNQNAHIQTGVYT